MWHIALILLCGLAPSSFAGSRSDESADKSCPQWLLGQDGEPIRSEAIRKAIGALCLFEHPELDGIARPALEAISVSYPPRTFSRELNHTLIGALGGYVYLFQFVQSYESIAGPPRTSVSPLQRLLWSRRAERQCPSLYLAGVWIPVRRPFIPAIHYFNRLAFLRVPEIFKRGVLAYLEFEKRYENQHVRAIFQLYFSELEKLHQLWPAPAQTTPQQGTPQQSTE